MKLNTFPGIPAGIFNNVSAQSDNSKPSVSKPSPTLDCLSSETKPGMKDSKQEKTNS